jgi:hypothetical protein
MKIRVLQRCPSPIASAGALADTSRPGSADFEQIQVEDWGNEAYKDEVAEEEEELARVHQEIKRLRKEQEAITRG